MCLNFVLAWDTLYNNLTIAPQACISHVYHGTDTDSGHGYTRVRTTAIAIYEERKTPNIADANGIPNAG